MLSNISKFLITSPWNIIIFSYILQQLENVIVQDLAKTNAKTRTLRNGVFFSLMTKNNIRLSNIKTIGFFVSIMPSKRLFFRTG